MCITSSLEQRSTEGARSICLSIGKRLRSTNWSCHSRRILSAATVTRPSRLRILCASSDSAPPTRCAGWCLQGVERPAPPRRVTAGATARGAPRRSRPHRPRRRSPPTMEPPSPSVERQHLGAASSCRAKFRRVVKQVSSRAYMADSLSNGFCNSMPLALSNLGFSVSGACYYSIIVRREVAKSLFCKSLRIKAGDE
jgi:hypothetical protein